MHARCENCSLRRRRALDSDTDTRSGIKPELPMCATILRTEGAPALFGTPPHAHAAARQGRPWLNHIPIVLCANLNYCVARFTAMITAKASHFYHGAKRRCVPAGCCLSLGNRDIYKFTARLYTGFGRLRVRHTDSGCQ